MKLQLNLCELKEEITVLEKQQPRALSYQFNTRRVSLEPIIFTDLTLSLLLQWCRAIGNLYGVQVSILHHFNTAECVCILFNEAVKTYTLLFKPLRHIQSIIYTYLEWLNGLNIKHHNN